VASLLSQFTAGYKSNTQTFTHLNIIIYRIDLYTLHLDHLAENDIQNKTVKEEDWNQQLAEFLGHNKV